MIYAIYGLEGVLLLLAGLEDMRKREISVMYILSMGVIAVCSCFLSEGRSIPDAVGGCVIGLCMMGISIISEEQVGRGDGMVIAALGFLFGVRNTLGMVCMASILMLFAVIVLLITKRAGKKSRIPFIPAIFGAYVMNLILGGVV